MIDDLIKYAQAGFTIFRCWGRRPIEKWKSVRFTPPERVAETFGSWKGQFGIKLTSQDLVIDVDPRNFDEGDDPSDRLLGSLPIENYGCFVTTPRGGLHIYLRLPEGHKIPKVIQKQFKGIDFKSEGGYVLAAANEGYKWSGGVPLECIADCPHEVLDQLEYKSDEDPEETGVFAGDSDEDEEAIDAYSSYLLAAPPAIQGSNGDAMTLQVAMVGRDWGFSKAKTLELMAEHYDPRCLPPWGEELEEKVHNAFLYAKSRPGTIKKDQEEVSALLSRPVDEVVPAAIPLVVSPKYAIEFRGWDQNNQNELKSTVNNVANYFVMENSPLRGIIGLNEFSGRVVMIRPAPWHQTKNFPERGIEWSDNDTASLRMYLSQVKRLDASSAVLNDAIDAVAQAYSFHPVRDYLNQIKWDGTPRLDSWAVDVLGVKDTPYNRAVGKLLINQAVTRVMRPGCQADYVVVLEGDQGVRKSSLVKVLGYPWDAVIHINLDRQADTVDAMMGSWFCEMAEMEVFKRADAQALDGFITRRDDRVRLAYGRRSRTIPRQNVFVGTINPDATKTYLTNPTGARRWMPLEIDRVIDTDKVEHVKNQLFAEAYLHISSGGVAHITEDHVRDQVRQVQKSRMVVDAWFDSIAHFCETCEDEFISGSEIFTRALDGSLMNYNTVSAKRIAHCLSVLGYEKQVVKGKSRYRLHYKKPSVSQFMDLL